jgi:hypothetical protein
MVKPSAKIIWLGGAPKVEIIHKSKKGISWENMKLYFHDKHNRFDITVEKEKGEWLLKTMNCIRASHEKTFTFVELKEDFEMQFDDFELFWFSKPIVALREFGLISV